MASLSGSCWFLMVFVVFSGSWLFMVVHSDVYVSWWFEVVLDGLW